MAASRAAVAVLLALIASDARAANPSVLLEPFKAEAVTPLSLGRAWFINFDDHPKGRYSAQQLDADWFKPVWVMGRKLIRIVGKPEAYSGKALELRYPKGKSGCFSRSDCILWLVDLGVKTDSLYYGFRFKLDKDFDYVKGGKLPGVAGGKGNTGGRIPNGRDGWSVRMMWNDAGRPVQYVYHPDQPEKWGDALFWDYPGAIKRGVWHTVQTWVKLNTPGRHDGVIKTWLNGKRVLKQQNMRFRDIPGLQINRFQFVSFFGGHGPDWAPQTDQTAWIDDVRFSLNAPVFPLNDSGRD